MSAAFMESNIFSTILRALCSLFVMALVFQLVEFAVKVWWIPLTVSKFMEKQGIRGPPYKFLHGNNKEVGLMIMESTAKPMNFSHDICPRVQPHLYSWIKIHVLQGAVLEMAKSVEEMLGRWRDYDGRDTEISSEFRVLTLDVISRTAFGSSYVEGKNTFDLLATLGKIVASNIRKIKFPGSGLIPSRDEVEAKLLDQQITRSIMKMIEARQEKLTNEDANGYGDDYFGMLLQSQANSKISMQDIVDECKTFYLAGHETTSALLTWTAVLLAMHPEWQERARKEVIQVLCSNTPSIDGLAQLKIMNMIINESLRLYPPIQHQNKVSTKKARVGKYTIPSGMELVVPILTVHHDPSQWGEDVNLFNPDRFAQGVMNAASTQVSFIPFGHGPRICVGLNFATLEAKVALSMILRRYTFTLSPSYQHAPIHRITMVPQHGAQIIIHSL
ncbi:hypothetical protein AMTRI_Chr10g226890 [Amborella trichopoda]